MALLNKSGISTGQTVTATHITNIYDTFNESGSFTVQASGSFSGSFHGNGSALTGITAEWDGTLNGDAQITGSLVVTQGVSANHITASGNIRAVGNVSSSGDITGNRVFANTVSTTQLSSTTGLLTIQAPTLFALGAPVTASSNISASGTITANAFVGDGAGITGIISSSYALTASHASNAGTTVAANPGGSPGSALSTITIGATDFSVGGGGSGTQIASGSTSASADPGTGVVVNHSGSTAFSVIGSVGTLFSVDDDLTGTLFTANDVSGLPVLKAEANGEVYLGKSPQSLYTTAVVSSTVANVSHSLSTLSTSSYDGAFFEYTATSASNARAGNIMSTWNSSATCSYAETTTTDVGNTSDLTTKVIISGSTARLIAYGPNASYKIKTIIKAI
jgi:hypothetical protein